MVEQPQPPPYDPIFQSQTLTARATTGTLGKPPHHRTRPCGTSVTAGPGTGPRDLGRFGDEQGPPGYLGQYLGPGSAQYLGAVPKEQFELNVLASRVLNEEMGFCEVEGVSQGGHGASVFSSRSRRVSFGVCLVQLTVPRFGRRCAASNDGL